jgi:hypothetical protein
MWRVVIAAGVMLAATALAARGEGLEVAHRYAIADQVQVLKYVVTDNVVYAAVRTGLAGGGNHSLVAFDRETERMLWRNDDVPEAYQLTMAGDLLALAYDSGSANAERGLVMVQAATGKVTAEAKLDGRPATLEYWPQSKVVTLVVYPQRRMSVIDPDTTMEVQAYNMEAKRTWMASFKCSELAQLGRDGKYLAVLAYGGSKPGVISGVEAATGKVAWSWAVIETLPVEEFPVADAAPNPAEHVLVMLNRGEACGFLRMTDGKLVHVTAAPKGATGLPVMLTEGRLVFLYWPKDERRWSVVRAKDGVQLWMEEGAFETVVPPVQWGDKLAVTVRKSGPAANGVGMVTKVADLRVYRDSGKLLATLGKEETIAINDTVPPRAHGSELFIAMMDAVVALRLAR